MWLWAGLVVVLIMGLFEMSLVGDLWLMDLGLFYMRFGFVAHALHGNVMLFLAAAMAMRESESPEEQMVEHP